MLFRVAGKIEGHFWEVGECDCCGSLIDVKEHRCETVDKIVDAGYPDEALAMVEGRVGFDDVLHEWTEGPYIDELPVDQVMRRLNAPALFAV